MRFRQNCDFSIAVQTKIAMEEKKMFGLSNFFLCVSGVTIEIFVRCEFVLNVCGTENNISQNMK